MMYLALLRVALAQEAQDNAGERKAVCPLPLVKLPRISGNSV